MVQLAQFTMMLATLVALTGTSYAQCPVDHDRLLNALKDSVKPTGGVSNGGFDTNEWAAVVDRSGLVCAIAYSGPMVDAQWPGSRLIAAEKANTANGLSLDQMALSTANLYAPAQPGGSLYGLVTTHPINTAAAYAGSPADFGSAKDPLVGKPIGGVVVFGGGLALYNEGKVVGGLGASGDFLLR